MRRGRYRGLGSSTPYIVFATDVVALQETLRDYATELGNAVAACTNVSAPGYDAMVTDWSALRNDVVDFIAEPPGYFWNEGTQYAAGQVLMTRLGTMSTRIGTLACTTPPAPPSPEGPPTPDWVRVVQWGTVAVVVAAGAWGISQVVGAIPKPKLVYG